jgi:lipopolysaccharide export system permease protein
LIINRYLIREICTPLAVIVAVLVVLFGSYCASDFLSDAVNGLLPTDMIAGLIGLKVLIALEVLIPISLYISVVLSFSKLYGDSEFTAMFALRVTPTRVMSSVLALSGCLAIGVGGLSLIVRPWAYQKLHELSDRAEVMIDVHAMEAGTFYVGQHGDRVIFLSHRDGPGAPARDVFVRLRYSDHVEIIRAQLGYPLPRTVGHEGSRVYLSDVHIYEIADEDGKPNQALTARGITLNLDAQPVEPPAYAAVAAGSLRLAGSDEAADIAEFQWRLSTPLTTLLLGMLGVPLSRARPRQNKYAKFTAAILVYSGYYLLCTSARTWVQHGVVAQFPGIWWVPALLSLLLIVALCGPNLRLRFRHGRA